MKKSLAFLLCLIMVVAAMFVGCAGDDKTPDSSEKADATLKFGSAVFVSAPATTDATADKEGTGKVDVTPVTPVESASGSSSSGSSSSGPEVGMSGSYEAAILEGATLVRVGTAIYGERYYPNRI